MVFKTVDFKALREMSEEDKNDLIVEVEGEEDENEVQGADEDNSNENAEDLNNAEDDSQDEDNSDEDKEEDKEPSKEDKDSDGEDKSESKKKETPRESRAQKRIRELVAQRKEAEAELEKERKEKKELAKAVKASQKSSVSSQKAAYEAKVEASEKALADALENEDHAAFVKAQKELVTSQTQLLAINNWEAKQTEDDSEEEETKAPAKKDPQKIAAGWMGRNPWYVKGGKKAELANKVSHLMEVEGLYDPSTEEFYEELDARLAEMEDEAEERTTVKEKTKKLPQTTAGGTQTPAPTKGGRKVVRLTAKDKQTAKKMGVPLEVYAKYKAISEKSDGGYVEINV